MDLLSLIMKAETEGLDNWAEAVRYAQALIDTGLVNSTGSNQRFVLDCIANGWTPGQPAPCIVVPNVDGPTFDDCMCAECRPIARAAAADAAAWGDQ